MIIDRIEIIPKNQRSSSLFRILKYFLNIKKYIKLRFIEKININVATTIVIYLLLQQAIPAFLTEKPPVPAVENAIFILSKIPIPPNSSKTNRIIVSNIYIVY